MGAHGFSGESKNTRESRMKNKKFALAYTVFALLFFSGCGVAFAQTNIPGFRGMDRHEKKIVPPPAPADTVAGPNMNCNLILPKAPLTATGLSTPFLLTATDPTQGPCNETNTAQSAFAQAAIFDPATNSISVYNPLVIDEGTSPAVLPVVPVIPPGAIVALWFGYNADNLTLVGSTPNDLANANCVNGLPGSVFSQYSYCNAPAFFRAANNAIANGSLAVPPLGTALDGLPCPTVRDFFVVDQDQSDNLPTLYLIAPNGLLAQYNTANLATYPTGTPLGNPSDNRLTDVFLDGALGCQPWTAPNLADVGGPQVPALPLNELLARMKQGTPVALVPDGDPMTELNGNYDILKTNLYRQGVDQPVADSYFDVDTPRYCRQMLRIAPARMFQNQTRLTTFNINPIPAAANSLFTFMAQRFVASYEILNCANLILEADPITVVTDSNGVATSATLSTVLYSQEVQDLANQKAADDAADAASKSLQRME
jgi:hypothetical protein